MDGLHNYDFLFLAESKEFVIEIICNYIFFFYFRPFTNAFSGVFSGALKS